MRQEIINCDSDGNKSKTSLLKLVRVRTGDIQEKTVITSATININFKQLFYDGWIHKSDYELIRNMGTLILPEKKTRKTKEKQNGI